MKLSDLRDIRPLLIAHTRIAAGALLLGSIALGAALPTSSAGATTPINLYAYASGSGTGCTSAANHCSLTTVVGLLGSGTYVVNLESTGVNNPYYGGFTLNHAGTVVNFTKAPSVSGTPVFGGGDIVISQSVVSLTNVAVNNDCNNDDFAPIRVGSSSTGTLNVNNVQFTTSCATIDGGAIDLGDNGGTASASIKNSSFVSLRASDGGAIDVGDNGGHGTLNISNSSFSDDVANDGGAIDVGDNSGSATAHVSSSTFAGDDSFISGGAIDSGDHLGSGTLTISASTFVANLAQDNGGAINAGDWGGRATVTITSTNFESNATTVGDGGALDLGDSEPAASQGSNGTATISTSSFTNNVAFNCGGAIDSGDNGSNFATSNHLSINSSSFTSNHSLTGNGGAINNGDGKAPNASTLVINSSSFTKNDSGDWGGAIANADDYGKGTVTILRTLFNENASSSLVFGGGAISSGTYGGTGVISVGYSSFINNGEIDGAKLADNGGAIFNGSFGTATIWRTTFNAGAVGNAIYNKNIIKIAGSLVVGNGSALCQASNTGVLTSYGYNIEVDGARSCGFHQKSDAAGVALKMGPLQANGGSPLSEMVGIKTKGFEDIAVGTSVKMGTSSTLLCAKGDRDQRGVPAPKKQRCNSGAVDAQTP
jgi:hypothetical protein